MSSLGGTLLSCRGAAASARARAARSEPRDLTGDADSGVVINAAPFPSQMRKQALVPEPRAGGDKQRSTELTCQEPPPAPSPQRAPGAGLAVSTDPQPGQGSSAAASAATGGSALHPPRRDGAAALRQPEPSALAPALPSLTPAPLSAKCKCFINRKAERHKPPRLASHHMLPPLPALACPSTGIGGTSSEQSGRALPACAHCISPHADP